MRRFRMIVTGVFALLALSVVALSVAGYYYGYTDGLLLAMKICGYPAIALLWVNAAAAAVEYALYAKKQKKDRAAVPK